ncbi:MAG TPA: hypothetical protein VG498_11445, partial [Terriglobales bacterium]|nr:hypothetical protein [Terriglobales bacterium]
MNSWRGDMTLPEKRDELNRIDEQTTQKRLNEQSGYRGSECRIEEHHAIEDRLYREQRERDDHVHGHDFVKDIHPERYPRESLSRLEEGILEDDEVRHEHDRLPYSGPDVEVHVEDSRNLSRTLMV